MNQIRLQRTPEIEKALEYLKDKYRLLSEAEIVKVALSEKYYNESQEKSQKEQDIRKVYADLMRRGKKLGDRFLAKKGLKRRNVSEEDFYKLLEQD